MSKILNEIDHLEGIAQAYKRGRPIVPMTGAIEDCNDARVLFQEIAKYDKLLEGIREDIVDTEKTLSSLRDDEREFTTERAESQEYLDKLMAALSARLER